MFRFSQFNIFVVLFGLISTIPVISAGIETPPLMKVSMQQVTTDSSVKVFFHNSWLSRDKGLHLTGSIILTTGIGASLDRFTKNSESKTIRSAAAITLMVGVLKELRDASKKNNKFSGKDLAYDIAGVLIGVILLSSE